MLQSYRVEYLTELSVSCRYARVAERLFSSSFPWNVVRKEISLPRLVVTIIDSKVSLIWIQTIIFGQIILPF